MKTKKRFLSVLLSFVLLWLMTGMSIAAYADEPTEVTNQTSWNTGSYVVNGTVNIDSRITVNGNVNLLLSDGATLNANGGITVEGNNSLTIAGTGTLKATGVADEEEYIYPAGIGSYEGAGGTVIINGGNVNAKGSVGEFGGGAGIGGCYSPAFMDFYGCLGANVTINGGNVTAIGGTASPGIGDGIMYAMNTESVHPFSSVTINGGTVTATGNSVDGGGGGAGIGGGYGGHGVNVTITGGTVKSTGGNAAAGIGDGSDYPGKYAATIKITGGTVTASGGSGYNDGEDDHDHGAGIGAGCRYNDSTGKHEISTRGKLEFSNVTIYAGGNSNPTTEYAFDGDFPGWTYFNSKHDYQYVIIEGSSATTYSVNVTAGDNMTKTTDSGDASQTDLSGAMTDVVYTANDGYYFPTDYSVDGSNGITVTRDSYTQITVSGTPTDNTEITLTAATAKEEQTAPTGLTATKASGDTAADGKISGVTDAMEYREDGDAEWTAVGDNQTEITGLTAGTYSVRYAGTDDKNASPATTVEVGVKADATVTKAPEAKTLTYTGDPQALVTAGEATGGEMQYALGTETEATQPYTTSIPAKTDVGTYYVWYKVVADENHLDTTAEMIEVVIGEAEFGTPDFTMPEELAEIGEGAFEGLGDMKVVDAHSCTAIGKDAFKDTGLTQIRLPKDCDIDTEAFGAQVIYVFAPADGTTQAYCDGHDNLVFIAE